MPVYTTVEVEHDARGFATLWLNRPEKNNAFNALMISELTAAISRLNDDANLRFLIVRGRGKHFSAGADLAWMQQSAQMDYSENLADSEKLAELMYSLQGMKVPTLAVAHGAVYGGAVGLLACCDMAIGAVDATICLSEVRIGLIPAVISPFVVKALGQRAARRFSLTAHPFNGQRAYELGLFSECYASDALEEALESWVKQLLNNSPAALVACKDLLDQVDAGELCSELRQLSERAIARIRVSPQGQEGLHSFLEKRSPAWQELPQ